MEGLPALATIEADRAEVRAGLLTALPCAAPGAVGTLVAALLALVTTEADRTEARTALLNALPAAAPGAVGDLVAVLRFVSPCQSWLAWLANRR